MLSFSLSGSCSRYVHTAFDDAWNHWIKLRSNEASGKVHPCMKELADKLVKLINK